MEKGASRGGTKKREGIIEALHDGDREGCESGGVAPMPSTSFDC